MIAYTTYQLAENKPVHSKTYGSMALSTSSLCSGVVKFKCKLPRSVDDIGISIDNRPSSEKISDQGL